MNKKLHNFKLHIRFLCIVSFFIVNTSFGQSLTGDYQTVTSGNWSTLSTWVRYNGTLWVQPTVSEGYPGELAVGGN